MVGGWREGGERGGRTRGGGEGREKGGCIGAHSAFFSPASFVLMGKLVLGGVDLKEKD